MLSDKLDRVTIQLSDNLTDFATYEINYEDLIEYVKEKSPNTRIIVIDDFCYMVLQNILGKRE